MTGSSGQVTVPGEAGYERETLALLRAWGGDAVRDSDGTSLSDELRSSGARVYATYFVSRGHNGFAAAHLEARQHIALSSRRVTAASSKVTLSLTDGFFAQQITPDYTADSVAYWDVMDRTAGCALPRTAWMVDEAAGAVRVREATPFHEYSVSFLAYVCWDPTQLYNTLTNDWRDTAHDIPFDVRNEAAWAYTTAALSRFLEKNPAVEVVRFTTFFYHFTLVFDERARERYVDWFGYTMAVSPAALQAFEREYGYALRAEDLVDAECYHNALCPPNARYRDFMRFVQRFVCARIKTLVDMTHQAGREAMMFLGDNWIGAEPYGEDFADIGLDAVVGSVGSGTTLRMLSDIRGVRYREARFLPYLFPDSFYEGGAPEREALRVWRAARRAMLRRPIERMGYGGYLHLAARAPAFVETVSHIAEEFRTIYAAVKDEAPYCALKVAVINAWGELRSWQTHMVAHEIPYRETYPYLGVTEALSGMAVEVSFLSLEEIAAYGVPQGIQVLLNVGAAGDAYSGGDAWRDPQLIAAVRRFVYEGGGLIGVGEPSAVWQNGRFFQLADVLGVEREQGLTLSADKCCTALSSPHFLTADLTQPLDCGDGVRGVYACDAATAILAAREEYVQLAAHDYGQGRAVYVSGLPFSQQNTRLLLRALLYTVHREDKLHCWFAENPACEVHAYPTAGRVAVLNQSEQPQTTAVFDGEGYRVEINLEGGELRFLSAPFAKGSSL